LVPSNSSNDKGKRKIPLEPRHSSRLQQKQSTAGGTSKSIYVVARPSSSGTSTDSLLDHFPVVNFQDVEVISLFEELDFSLGSQKDIKIIVVTKFRSLLKSRFKKNK
jgi:hypothetical protein